MLKKENIFSFINEGLLMAFVVFVFLFGGTELTYRSYAIQLFAFSLFASTLWRLLLNRDSAFCYPRSIFFMLIFLAIIFFQCLPLPMEIVKLLSPKTAAFYQSFLPPDSQRHWHTLSVYPFATQKKLAELVALLSIFFFTVNAVNTKNQLKRLITLCVGMTVFLSLYAAVKGHFAPERIFPGLGLFSNRNYYAGLTLLMSFLCLGYGFSLQGTPKKNFFIFLATLLSINVVLSLSRAAIISWFFWLCIMIVWFIQQRLFTRKVAAMFALLLAILLIFFLIVNLEPLIKKLEETNRSIAMRFSAYRDALFAVKDFSVLGVGLGNYGYVATQYSSRSIVTADPYLHNDHIQLVVESGIVGSIFYCLFFVFLFRNILIKLYKRRDPFIKCVALAGLCGIFALTSHAFLEVLFPIPAIAFLSWFVIALLYKSVYIHSYTIEG